MNWLNLILSELISIFLLYIVTKNLSGIKFQFKQKILYFIILCPLLLIFSILFDGLNKMIITFILVTIVNYFILLNRQLGKSIFYCIVCILLVSVIEFIVTVLLISILSYSIEDYNNMKYSLLIFTIINSILSYIISCIPFIKNIIRKLEIKLVSSKFSTFYLLFIAILVLLLIFNNFINYEKNIQYYINFSMLIFIIVVSIFILFNKISKDNIEKDYKEMMEYVSKYEKIINEQGKKNHEFNNQLMVLYGYIDNKKKLKEYLDSMIEGHKGGKNYTIEQLSYFPDGGLKGLIYHKLSRIEEYNIKPYLYIDKNVKETFENKFDVNTYTDITKLFGVFLDNAIEAAKDADKKEIEIDMKIKDNYLTITISNTYNKDIDVNKIGKKGFTTKGVGHGFGLSLVKDISKKNSKIETVNDVDNDMFKQTILIDLK